MGLDRLALIKARLAGKKPVTQAYKAEGQHVSENPDEKVTRLKKVAWNYNDEKKAGPGIQNLSIFAKSDKVIWFRKKRKRWKAKMRESWLEAPTGKGISPLTKIAFTKPKKLPRVPPWQRDS